MDKKKVVKWTLAILANLMALTAVFLTANPQLLSKKTKKDSLDDIKAARFVPSYRKSAHAGMLTRMANEVNDKIAADQRLREMRERKMSRNDTIINREKVPVQLLQQIHFESLFSEKKDELDAMRIGKEKNAFGSKDYSESDWDKVNNTNPNGKLDSIYWLKTGVQVYGWHPYWMGSAYKTYNFSLLSTIAYYGLQFDPNSGDTLTTHGWKSSGLIKKIEDDTTITCRTELTVINLGDDDNTDFFSEIGYQRHLIDGLTDLISKHGDGICLDFEGVPFKMRDSLTQFVALLRDSLQYAGKFMVDTTTRNFTGFTITMVLPCFDWTGAYDVKKLAPLVDRFVVTGYDYYGSLSDTVGPVAPLRSGLKWRAPNIERSVEYYLAKGIPAPKLLLGIPYYGASWQSLNTNVPSPRVRFDGFKLYKEIRNQMALRDINYDTSSVSAYYVSKGTLPMQYWFDDAQTLSEKYRWVQRNRLGGVGIWALGYDNGYTELWKSLRDNFARYRLDEDTTYRSRFVPAAHDTTALPPDKEWGIVAANGHYLIFDSPYVLLYGTLAVFALILLLQVVLDDQPFNELFSRRLLLFILSSIAGTVAIIFLGLALWSNVLHREIYLVLSGIIGGYLLFRLTQRIVGKKERLP